MSPIGDWVATTKMLENIDNVYTYKFSRNILLFPNNLGQRGKITHQVSQSLNRESVHSSWFKKACRSRILQLLLLQGGLCQSSHHARNFISDRNKFQPYQGSNTGHTEYEPESDPRTTCSECS